MSFYNTASTTAPAAGVVVRIIGWRGPGDPRPSAVYGTTTTGADGTFVVTGIPPGTEYATEVNPTWGPTWGGGGTGASYQLAPIVPNAIVAVGEFTVDRYITMTPANGATVPAGALVVTWTAVPGGNVYCLTMTDETAGALLTKASASCGNRTYNFPMVVEVRGTSWTAPALVSGHHYFLDVLAYDRTDSSLNNPELGAGGSLDFSAR